MFKDEKTIFRKTILALSVSLLCGSMAFADSDDHDDNNDNGDDGSGVTITFAHSGDFHGDYHPHTNGRADNAGMLEGGIARGVTVLNKIRAQNDAVIHVHTGDTIHGSGEASITKGMALVKMVDQLGIDVSTPGNWEWAYTPYRYMQFFGVHDTPNGTNMDIIPDDDFDEDVYKAVKYSTDENAHEDDKIGDVPTFGTEFKAVKYVSGFDGDGNPIMATGYNRWGMVAANAYENGTWALDHGVSSKGTGMNLTPPYRVIEKAGVKIGFIGCTTNRGPQVVSSTITTGVSFSNCKGGIKFPQNRPIDWDDASYSHGGTKAAPGGKVTGNPADLAVAAFNRNSDAEAADDAKAKAGEPTGWNNFPHWSGVYGYKVQNEIVKWTNHLRKPVSEGGEGVDLVAVMSEAGIAENIQAAENLGNMANGPDIYFSSDMHEETNFPVVVTDPNNKKVIIIENPEDIAQISELDVVVKDGAIASWSFKGHDVNEKIREDREMRDMVAEIDQDIANKIDAGDAYNPYNGHNITYQLTDVVGETDDIVLERNRFSNEHDPENKIMPGVIEGTGHALITDVFRKFTGADVGGLRGFRYTNSVLDGDDITYKSLYHMFPIGAQIAVGAIPSTPSSEKALTKLSDITPIAGATYKTFNNGDPSKPDYIEYITYPVGFVCKGNSSAEAVDSNCNGVVMYDQADNKRHFVGFPRSLQQEMELGMNSSHNPNIPAWGGGWSWNYSGITWDAQPSGSQFNKWGLKESARISNIDVYDNANGNDGAVNAADGKLKNGTGEKAVKYASYYYHEDYNRINRNQLVTKGKCKKTVDDNSTTGAKFSGLSKDCVVQLGAIQILVKIADGSGDYAMVDALEYDADIGNTLAVLDATEAMGRYISDDDGINVYDWENGARKDAIPATGTVDPLRTVVGLDEEFDGDDFVYPRANLVMANGEDGNDLTDCTAEFGFPCIQPMRGSEAALDADNISLPGSYIKGTADDPALSGTM